MLRSLLLLLFCISDFACSIERSLDERYLTELSNQKTWLKLGLYEREATGNAKYISSIHSTDFFISENGAQNPYDELLATIIEFNSPFISNEKNSEHAICRFPARLIWLKKVLPKALNIDRKIICNEYKKWSYENSTESISIVYVTGYLGNPASFYGHTLLKFNSSKIRGKTKLADVSVNYGAIIPKNENPVTYIFKGLSGGYDAGFSHIDYYFHNHNYGEKELRDMWEYELSLTPQESRFVVAHAWELLGKKYTYYFLRKNCAYRMAELFEIIDSIDIKPETSIYLIPQSLIQKLAVTYHSGQPLVKRVEFHPSRQTRFYKFFDLLTAIEKKHFQKIIHSNGRVESDSFSLLPEQSQKRIIDTVLDYYQYIIKKNGSEDGQIQKDYERVLALRFTLPTGKQKIDYKSYIAPHNGRLPSLTNIALLDKERMGTQLAIRIRPAYYDSLDSGAGHIDHSALTMGGFGLRLGKQKSYLSYLDLFKVESINSQTTGLPGDTSIAWNLRAGFSQIHSTVYHPVFGIQGDYGNSFRLGRNLLLAAYLGGGVQDNIKGYGNVFLRGLLTTHFDFGDIIRFKVNLEYREYVDSNRINQNIYSFVGRYQLTTNEELRVFYRDDANVEFGLSYGFYW